MAQVFDTELEATSLPVVDVQVPEQAPEQAPLQDPPSKKLWKALTAKENGELYTKSYDEFVKQYSTPEAISKLHSNLISPEFGELYTKGLEDFNSQYFPELKKKEEPVTEIPSVDLSELGTSGSQGGASNFTTPTPSETPIDTSGRITFEQKEPYQPQVAAPDEPAPANTIDLILQANDNLNKKIGKIKDQAGRERDIDQPDLKAQTEGKRTLDYLKTFKIDTDDLYNKIKDLPPEIYNTTRSNQDGTIDNPYSKEKLFEMYQNEPAKFTFTVNHLKNMADITKSAEGATIDGQPVDKSYFGKLYNNLNVGTNLQDWEQKKGQQIELINKYLPSLDARRVALDRLETNASMYYTPANPDVMAEYNASPLKDKLDPSQFAALQMQKMFNPKVYEQSIGFLNVKPQTETEVTQGVSFTRDGLVLNQAKETESEESIKTKVGKESTLKNLADAGRYNTIMNLQFKNEKIASKLKAFSADQNSQLVEKYNAGAEELKKLSSQNEELKNNIEQNLGKYKEPYIQQYNANIQRANSITQEMNGIAELFKQMPQDNRGQLIAQFNDNLAKINAIKADYKKDAERYPNYFDLKYEQQVKDFMQQSGFTAAEYGIMKFGMGLVKTGRALENVGISLFGNNEDKIIHDLASYGESQVEAQDEYLPSKYQMGNNLVSIKVNNDLQTKLDAVIKGRDLSDLSTGEKDVLKNILAQNQDQVHTITDTEKEGKGANFFSLATLYANTGMLGDIMSFAVQGGGLAALGVRGVLASAIPMWTTTQDDFRKEGIAKGLTGSELDGYANLNASIMFLAGTVTPQLDVLKRMVGTQTSTGKMLAGITEDTWNSVINKNRPIIDRIKNSVLHTTGEAAKMTGTFGIGAPALQQIVGKEMYNDRVSYTDIKNNVMESGEHLLKSSVALLGVGAITNFKSTSPEQKAALWQLGANPKIRLAEIEDALKNGEINSTQAEARKKVIQDASNIIQTMPTKNMQGKPLTDKQRVDYFYNLLIQDKAKTEKKSLPIQQVKKIEYAEMVADHLNNLIVDPQDETQLNGRIKELNKILKTDENDIDAKAELDAINIHLENLAQEKEPTKTPEEILTGKPVTLLPLEIGGFKVISEETPVGGERVFKVIDNNGVERFLTADGKELRVSKATVEVPAEITTTEVAQETELPTAELPQETETTTEVTAPTLEDIRNEFGDIAYRVAKLQTEKLGEEYVNLERVRNTANRIIELGEKDKGAAVAEALQYEMGYPDNWTDLRNAIEKGGIEMNADVIKRMIDTGVELPKDILDKYSEFLKEKEVIAPKLEEGAIVELPPQVKGALPRKMIFKEGIWQEQVGSQITGVSEKVQQQAQTEWETKNPVTEQPVVAEQSQKAETITAEVDEQEQARQDWQDELNNSGYSYGQYGGKSSDTYYITDNKTRKVVKEIKFTDPTEGSNEVYKWIDQQAGTKIFEKSEKLRQIAEGNKKEEVTAEEPQETRYHAEQFGFDKLSDEEINDLPAWNLGKVIKGEDNRLQDLDLQVGDEVIDSYTGDVYEVTKINNDSYELSDYPGHKIEEPIKNGREIYQKINKFSASEFKKGDIIQAGNGIIYEVVDPNKNGRAVLKNISDLYQHGEIAADYNATVKDFTKATDKAILEAKERINKLAPEKPESKKPAPKSKKDAGLIEPSELDKAKAARLAAKEKLNQIRNKLGAIRDTKAEAQALYDYHVATIKLAKEHIKEGIKTLEEFAKSIGEKVSDQLKTAWNEAQKNIKTIKSASQNLKYNAGEKEGISYLSESSNVDYPSGGGVQGEGGKVSQSIVGVWSKDKNLQFTGTTKVKTAADVAHIMQLLETKTVEHAFAVHIDKNGKSHIQFLSIGGVSGTVVDPKSVLAGVKKFKSVRTFLIHNHPSGNMQPSNADLQITEKIRAGLDPLGVKLEHVIMDTFSKEYIYIDQYNIHKVYKRDETIQDSVKLSTHSMNEMMILSNPIVRVRQASDAVNFLQQLRFTAMPKNGMLLLDYGNSIIGNYVFKGEIDYEQITSFVAESGTGSNVIFYGNNFDKALILAMKDHLSKLDIKVLDHIVTSSDTNSVNQYYESMMEAGHLSETQLKYGTNIVNEVGEEQNNITTQQKIEQLRSKEQAELDSKIPNAEQYRVDGKVDRNKLTKKEDIEAFDKIYNKYDKLITPLLKETELPKQENVGKKVEVLSVEKFTKKIEATSSTIKTVAGDKAYNYVNKDGVEVTLKEDEEGGYVNGNQIQADVHLDFIGNDTKRGEGLASKELDRIIKEADKNNMSISLIVDSDQAVRGTKSEKGLGNKDLKKWYESKGFIFDKDSRFGYRPKATEDVSIYKRPEYIANKDEVTNDNVEYHSSPQDLQEAFDQDRLKDGTFHEDGTGYIYKLEGGKLKEVKNVKYEPYENNKFVDKIIYSELPKQEQKGIGENPTNPVEPKTDAERKTIADKIRQAKLGKGKAFDATIGLPVAIWDGAVELVASSIEAGMLIADALKRGINYIEKNHRGKWDKKAYNDKVIEQLGYKGININGEDVIAKPIVDKQSAEMINGFYSPLEQGILDTKGDKFTGKEWAKKLEGTTEGDELKFTGMSDFLSENADKSLTKQEVLDYMKNNRIEINEIQQGTETDNWEQIGDEYYNKKDDGKADKKYKIVYDKEDEEYSVYRGKEYIRSRPTLEEAKEAAEESALQSQGIDLGGGATKYSEYQLPGESSNYKELLITLPENKSKLNENQDKQYKLEQERQALTETVKVGDTGTASDYKQRIKKSDLKRHEEISNELNKLREEEKVLRQSKDAFKSSHFEEPNILAHIRMNTRIDAEGNKVTHIEEFQSDYGQQARREGFILSEKEKNKLKTELENNKQRRVDIIDEIKTAFNKEDYATVKKLNEEDSNLNKRAEELNNLIYKNKGVPSAPFVSETKNWTKLAWKVALKEAVKEGADKITWTTGEQQNERYDLSKVVDEIRYNPNKKLLRVTHLKGSQDVFENVSEKEMENIIGKDISNKVLTSPTNENGLVIIKGDGLKIGGTGMKGFYGSPKEGKIGIVGEVIKSMTGQEPKTTKLDLNDIKIENNKYTQDIAYAKKGEDYYKLYFDPTNKDYSAGLFDKESGELIDLVDIGEPKNKEQAIARFTRKFKDAQLVDDFIDASTQYSIEITPEIKEGVKEGMGLFKAPFERTELQKAQEARRAAKAKLDEIKGRLGIAKDIEAQAQALFDYHKALVAEAKEYVKIGIKKVEDFAKEIGEKVDDAVKAAWNEAMGIIPPAKGPEDLKHIARVLETGMTDEEWTGISQSRMKEIESVRKIYEREKGTTWTDIQQQALEQLARKYPNKTIYEAARLEVEKLADKYDNKEDYNPTAKDLAVIQEFKRQTEQKINNLQEDLNSDIDLQRNLAAIQIEAYEDDLAKVGKALFKREAGTAFGFRASESMMDENYGLQIRRAKLIRANDGEPLSEADNKFLEDQWAKEKELMKKEQQIREQGLKDAFDSQLEKVKKDYEEKMKSMKAKTTPEVRKQALSKTGKDVADLIRRLKLRGVKLDFTLGTWNLAIEGIARITEAGFTVAEAIEQLIQNKTIGFKTAEDRKIFEDNLASFINNLDRRETSLEDIKKMAQANGDTTVTIDMVKKGLIKDFINSHVGEFENKDILEEAYKELKKILPDLDRNTLRKAMLRLDEFKTPDKKTMENMLAQETRALKRLLEKEESQKVKGNEQQKRLLEKEKKSIQRKIREFQRKLKEGEFEKEEPVTLKKQDAELIQLNKEKKEAEGAFRKKQQELEEKNKHWLQRFGDTVRNTWVAFLIGSPVTLAKVGYMSLVRPSSEIIRKAVFGKLFNLIYPNISKASERGGESSSLRALREGLTAYFRQNTAASIEKKSQLAIQKYDKSAKAYYDALNTGADAKTLKRLEKQMNRDLENSLSNIIYQFIGGSSIKDSWQSFVNRSNEIEKQFGKVDIESIRDGNALDKMNYIMGFIGRSHSAAKTFSGRFSFAVSFMTRLEGAIKDGSISDPNRVIEIAHESYLDWERGKYQQDNWLTEKWNEITAAIRKNTSKNPKWKPFDKGLEFLTKSEVAITRVPVNVLWEQVGEYARGAFVAPIKAYREIKSAKAQAKMEGYDKAVNSAEFKKRVNEIVSTMDQDQAARIFRLFTKGGLGLGLYGLTLVTGLMHFGVFPHKGQKKKKEEYELEPEELNPGQVMFGDDKLGETASKLIEHTPALWPSFMGLGLAKIYADDVKAGKMTSQAAWDAVYTHLQIVEGAIPQTKVFSPLNVIKGVSKTWAGKASSYGMFDSMIDAKGNFIDKEKEGLKLTSPEVLRLQRYGVAPLELGTRKQYKIEIDKTHPRSGMTPAGKEYALMNPHEFTKFTEYRKSYIDEVLRELYRAEDGAYIGVDKDFRPDYVYIKPNRTIYNLMQNLANKPANGATIELNKQVLAEIMPIIISQSTIVAKNKLVEDGLLPESNYEDEEGNENIMTIKEIIQDLYENNMP